MKLNVKRTILVGFAFLSISMFWQMYDNLVAKMLVDNFGLNQAMSGILMALDNILALILLPLFGHISDRKMSKLGKRTPFIVYGTVFVGIIIGFIGVIDYYQQVAVSDMMISSIVKLGDGTFTYSIANVSQGIFTRSDLASAHRAKEIFARVTSQNPTILIIFIVVLFFVLIGMSAFRSPAVSLMPDVTPKPLRSKANAIINLMGTVGGVIALGVIAVVGALFKGNKGYVPHMIALSILMFVFLIVFLLTVKENKWREEMEKFSIEHKLMDVAELEADKKGKAEPLPKDVRRSLLLILSAVVLWFMGYNAATTKYSVYATTVLGLESFTLPLIVAQVAAAISFIPIGILSTKFGRRKTILVGIGILTFAFILAYFTTAETKVLMYVAMSFAGIGWATINVNSYPMVVEMSKGSNVGVYTGYYYTASMAAQIVTPYLSGLLMDLFAEKVPNIAYSVLFIYAAVFAALAFIPMFFVIHGEPHRLEGEKVELHIDVD